MTENSETKSIYEGTHLSMIRSGRWEFVTRKTARLAVAIVAITDSREIILVEQHRPPVGRAVVELPAGLVGDIAGLEDESLLDAARRELEEETGYTARCWKQLGRGYSSPGLTDETIVLFLASELEKSGPGGGDESESIVIHNVRIDEVTGWLAENNHAADLKLLTGLYLLQQTEG